MTTQATTPPTQQDAQAYVERELWIPAFFDKLASYQDPITGRPLIPQNEDEAERLLRMGAKMRNQYQQEQVKAAQATSSFIVEAEQRLDTALGVAQPAQPPLHLKQAAAHVAQDPTIQQMVRLAMLGPST